MSTGERPQYPVGVNVAVIRGNKILLGKRTQGYKAGTWGLPGGHLEFGEAMTAAAARELMEETGMTAQRFEFANLVNDKKQANNTENKKHYLQVGFLAIEPTGEPALKEPELCEEWRWFDLADLPADIFPPHLEQVQLFAKGEKFIDN